MEPHEEPYVRRLVYSSVPAEPRRPGELDEILAQAKRNNGLNGVTGLLVAAEDRYVQVLEGTPEAVGHIMDAIRRDRRHTDVKVIDDHHGGERVFGGWTMADLSAGRDDPEVRRRLRRLLRNASGPVKEAFADLD